MTIIRLALTLLLACAAAVGADARVLAPTPPMGWNSWDAYGLTITEQEFRANVNVMARELKPYGWTYAVIDEGWFLKNPEDRPTPEKLVYVIDANGRYIPDPARFPSALRNGRNIGFAAIGAAVHARGLKFGIHIVRGIPRESVARNLPLAGSAFRAQDVADTSDACPWDPTNWGVKDNAAGQAWYDSLIAQYAAWGVDYLKVDCIADHPYKISEIRQIAAAIKKSGRPIVLSLSPGPTRLEHADEIAQYAQMWRISNDIWDSWHFPSDVTEDGYPAGVATAFDRLAKWNPYVRPGKWPDADMLPLGSLRPSPGMGDPRQSGLTHDEARTLFTLWSIARSPLILGGNLTELDPFTRSLLTNRRVIAINQRAWDSRPLADLPSGFEQARVWTALGGTRSKPTRYIAFFNLKDGPAQLSATWQQLGIGGAHAALDLWSDVRLPAARRIEVNLPAHGSAVYEVR